MLLVLKQRITALHRRQFQLPKGAEPMDLDDANDDVARFPDD